MIGLLFTISEIYTPKPVPRPVEYLGSHYDFILKIKFDGKKERKVRLIPSACRCAARDTEKKSYALYIVWYYL